MGIVGCGNDNQVYVGIVKQMLRLRDNRNRWPVSFYFCFIAAGDYRQLQPGRARNQGRMEGFARITMPQSTQHGCCRSCHCLSLKYDGYLTLSFTLAQQFNNLPAIRDVV